MHKLLKQSILALILVFASSTYAHAESVALTHGGFSGFIKEILDWLLGHSHNSVNSPNNTPNPPSGTNPGNNLAPEIDPSLAMSGFMLVGGTLTVLRGRRTKRPVAN
jgi:hypothetical protein